MADASVLVEIVGRETVSVATGQASSALGSLGGALTNVAATAAKTAVALAAIGGAGAAAGFAVSVNAAKNFEQQMSAVTAVMNKAELAAAGGKDALNQLALQLGKETSYSAVEAAKGLEELAKAGVSIKDIMGGGARAALDLAAAGGVEVATAAEIASNAMNVFGKSGSDMAHVANVIAGAANASAIGVNDYKFSLAAAGAVAATVGVSFEDLSTAIAVMGNAGIKGSDAGTSLKTMLLNLQPSTKAQKAAFQELGIITADGANQFFTAEGKAKSLAEIAGVLQNATKGMTDQQKLATLEVMFGTDAIRAAAIFTKAGAEGFEELAGAISQVTAQEVADERLNNLAGSLEKLKGSLETAAIAVGMKFTPVLKSLVDMATDGVNGAMPALESFAEAVAQGLQWMIDQVIAARPAIEAFGSALYGTARYLMEVTVQGDTLNDWLTHVPEGFRDLVQAGGELVVTLKDMATGLFSFASGVNATRPLAGFVRLVSEVGRTFKALLPTFVSIGRAVTEFVIDTFNFVVERVLPPVVSIVMQTARVFQDTLLPAARQTGETMRTILGTALTWLSQTVWPAFMSIVTQTSNFFTQTILPTLPGIAQALRQAFGETIQWVADVAWPALLNAARVAWGYIASEIIPRIPAFAALLRDVLGAAINWIATTGWPALVSAGRAVSTWIQDTAIPAITKLWEWLSPKLSAALEWLIDEGWPMLRSAAAATWNFIRDTAVPVAMNLWKALQERLSPIVSWFIDEGWPMLRSAAATAWGWIQDTAIPTANDLWRELQERLSPIVQWFIDVGWPSLKEAAATAWDWIKETAIPTANELWRELQERLSPIVSWFIDTGWPTLKSAAETAWGFFKDTVIPVANDLWRELQDRLSPIVQWFIDYGWPTLKSAAEGVWNWIKETAIPVANEFWRELQERLSPIITWFIDYGWPTLKTAAEDVWNWVRETAIPAANEFWQELQERLSPVVQWFIDYGWPQLAETGKAVHEMLTIGKQNAADFFLELDKRDTVDKIIEGFKLLAEAGDTLARVFGGASEESGLTARGNLAAQMLDVLAADLDRKAQGFKDLATAIKLIADALEAIKNAAEGWPDWLIDALRTGALMNPALRGPANLLPGAPGQPGRPRQGTTGQEPGVTQRRAPTHSTGYLDLINRIAAETGEDPALIAAIMDTEQSGAGSTSPAGARGLMQVMPGYVLPGEDPFDPETSIRQGIRAIQDKRNILLSQGYEATPEQIAGRYFGTGVDATGMSTGRYRERFRQNYSNYLPIQPGVQAPGGLDPQGLQNFRQTQQQWSQDARDANAICGPYLASLFTDAVGRPPSPEEARDLGVRMGVYSPSGGILDASRFDEYATALIQQTNPGSTMTVAQTAATGAQAGQIAADALAAGGGIVGFNTPGHYFGATDYNPETGQFFVGGTGTSLAGGSEWMTVEQMEAASQRLTGLKTGITGVLTLVDQGSTAFKTMGDEVEVSGMAAESLEPALSSVGAAIDPVVASFSEGTATVGEMTDAIIASAAEQGVATDSAAAYSDGLITQDEALRGVIAGFAETTPAAAELLAQLDAGAISTEEAAVAFAGLATTTAESFGEIGTAADELNTDVTANVEGLAEDSTLALETLAEDGTIAGEDLNQNFVAEVSELAQDGVTELATLNADGVTELDALAQDGTTAAEDLNDDSVREFKELAKLGIQQAKDLNKKGVDELEALADDGTTAAETLNADAMKELEELARDGVEEMQSFNQDAVKEMEEMAQDAASETDQMARDVVQNVQELADDSIPHFEEFADSVETTTGRVDDLAEAIQQVDEPIALAFSADVPHTVNVDGINADDLDADNANLGNARMGDVRTGDVEAEDIEGEDLKAEDAVLRDVTARDFEAPKGEFEDAEIEDSEITDSDVDRMDVSDFNAPGRAHGGRVERGSAYVVGELRPEVFIPDTDGMVYPSFDSLDPFERQQMSEYIDYDLLAAAVVSALRREGTGNQRQYNLTIHTQASHEPILQDFAMLEALARGGGV